MAKQRTKPDLLSRPSMLSEEKIIDSDPDSPKEQETKTRKGGDDAEMEEVSDDESSEESDASSSSEAKRPAPSTKVTPPMKKARPAALTAIASKTFKPPIDFEKTTFSASDYAGDSTEFLTKDLSQKQVWHITAPASVDIETIQPFSIADVRSGKPIFSKDGVDYGFLTGLHKAERLLLASGETVEYVQSTAPISGTYHLREIGRLPTKKFADSNKENAGISFAATSTVSPKKPREQPIGLRMRYQPYGNSTTKAHPSSTSPAVFRMNAELPESQLDRSEKKRRRRKEKKATQANDNSQDHDAMDVDPTPISTLQNPSSGKPAESASKLADKVFEAATETPSKQKKRKKKSRITDEEDTL